MRPFFRVGGTLEPDAGSYLVRAADKNLLDLLTQGEYVFILDSRQKGKSSLVARVAKELDGQGVRAVRLDLQSIGANVTVDQWYAGFLFCIAQETNLLRQVFSYWESVMQLGPEARVAAVMRDVILPGLPERLVIFVDEIDFVRTLTFACDEFFGMIRDCYNRRSQDDNYTRLSFCLVGVATPSQLIRNPSITPFNIGHRVELSDFTLEECQPFATRLGPNGSSVIERVHFWTGGHPYLTQLLCNECLKRSTTPLCGDVDDIVHARFFAQDSRHEETNFADVERRLLEPEIPFLEPDEARVQVLDFYGRILAGRRVDEDADNPILSSLVLSGVLRSDSGVLKVRNRIYEGVFNESWRRNSLPGAEKRRQKVTAIRTMTRTALVASVILAAIGTLAINNLRLARVATEQRDWLLYETYVSTMAGIGQLWTDHNFDGVVQSINSLARNPHRGWEYQYWNRLVSDHLIDHGEGRLLDTRWSRDGKSVITRTTKGIKRGKLFISSPSDHLAACFEASDGRLVDISWSGTLTVYDRAGKQLWRDTIPDLLWRPSAIMDKQGHRIVGHKSGTMWCYDLRTRQVRRARDPLVTRPVFSPKGEWIVAIRNRISVQRTMEVVIIDPKTLEVVRSFPQQVPPSAVLMTKNSRRVVAGFTDGTVRIIETATGRTSIAATLDAEAWRMELSEDGKYLSVGQVTRGANVFRLDESKLTHLGTVKGVNDARFSPDGRTLLTTGSIARTMPLDNIVTHKFTIPPFNPFVLDGKSGTIHYASGATLTSRSFKNQSTPLKAKLSGVIEPKMRTDANNKLLKAYFDDQELWLDGTTGKEVTRTPKALRPQFLCIPLKGTRKTIFISSDYVATLWDDATETARALEAGKPYFAMASASGSHVVFCGSTGLMTIWDVWNDRWLSVSDFAPYTLHECVFTGEGSQIVAGFDDGVTRLIDLNSGQVVREFSRHADNARCVAISPDGKRLASGGNDKKVRIWDFNTGRLVTVLQGHSSEVEQVSFDISGEVLVSVGLNGEVLTWKGGR